MFPAGRAGAALLILRLSASSAFVLSLFSNGSFRSLSCATVALSALALALMAGLYTPIACVLVLLIQVITFRSGSVYGVGDDILHIGLTVMLLMLGPGAYSVDAKRFGRRIVLPAP